jgi:alpha-L-rhamnosidase
MHRIVAGLAPAEPGYRRLRIAPRPGGHLTSAAATHETPYGTAEVAWTLEGKAFSLERTVPPNTDAEVSLPDGSAPVDVGSGDHSFSCTVPKTARIEKAPMQPLAPPSP